MMAINIRFVIFMITLSIIMITICVSTPLPAKIQNLRARYDHSTDSIFLHWTFTEDSRDPDVTFVVRYRITNREGEDFSWKQKRVSTTEARLDLFEVRNGDELQAQVKYERNGQLIEDWSQSLLIAISKRVVIDGMPIDDDQLLPPIDFTAHILNPKSVRLQWTPVNMLNKGLYYIVNVKQLTAENDDEPLLRQHIKIESNSFILGSLSPGERYEMTIRSAISADRISLTAAIIEITMPRDDEYIEISNLVISSHFKANGDGIVNLTWDVPPDISNKIRGYTIEYSKVGTTTAASEGLWNKIDFINANNQFNKQQSVSINSLTSDTDYLIRIQTVLRNNLTIENGEFKFRTPKIILNPINKVDVIYTNEIDTIRLQWTLENFVNVDDVLGYEVYMSEDQEKPYNEWFHTRVDGKTRTLSFKNLKPATVYYIRINLRNVDDEQMETPSIYRFKTMDRTEFLERREANSLSYRNISPGRVIITWTYPSNIRDRITGTNVFYTERSHLSLERWLRKSVDSADQNSVTLEGLKPNTVYYVRIVPQIENSHYDGTVIDMFEIKTTNFRAPENNFDGDKMSQSNERFLQKFPPDYRGSVVEKNKERKTIIVHSCDPYSPNQDECSVGEVCVSSSRNRLIGWCINELLREAILN